MRSSIPAFFLIALLGVLGLSCTSPDSTKVPTWKAVLILDEEAGLILPFTLKVNPTENGQAEISIQNAEEVIELGEFDMNANQLNMELPVFESEMHLTKNEDGSYTGEWVKYGSRSIPLKIYPDNHDRFTPQEEAKQHMGGTWELEFSPGTEDRYPAIGQFTQTSDGVLTGTILTETGDYRYLEGLVAGDVFRLSTFDGAHAFYFEGTLKNNESLEGTFFSGSHWSEPFIGEKNKEAKLRSASELSFVHDTVPLAFRFQLPSGDSLVYPSQAHQNAPSLIQVLGTWCPNCMDETRLLIQMQNEFPDLKIYGLAFERSMDTSIAFPNIRKMKADLNVPYPVALAGTWSKKEASKRLPFLSEVISYPTLIFIDRNGMVRHVHTGFSGPGTGKEFDKTKEAIRNELLKIYSKAS